MFKANGSAHFLRLFLFLTVATCAAAAGLSGCSRPTVLPLSEPRASTPTPLPPTATSFPAKTATQAPARLPTASITPAPTGTLQPTNTPPGRVTIESIPITSRYLGNARTLSIYLPPGYASQPQQYKVLYVNDGQDLAVMGLEQDLNAFYASGDLEPIIVVGIPASDDRGGEYGTGPIKNIDGAGGRA